MIRFGLISATVATLAAAPGLAAEDDTIPMAGDEISKYRMAGKWTVYENATRGSCFITRADDNGSLVQMGLTKDKEYGYIGVFIKGAEIEEGERDIAILVNDNVYVGESHSATHLSDDYKGGYILANNKDLRMDLQTGDEMIAFPDAPYAINVDLEDVGKAIFEGRKCTDELQEQ